MIFDHSGAEVARHQLEHAQIMPRPGWVEHDPAEIWARTRAVVEQAVITADLRASDLAALGLTNQRETTLVWNRHTGRPYGHAIVWQDTRTDRIAATLDRDDELLGFFAVPRQMLPDIRPSSAPEPYGLTSPDGPFGAQLPITGALGDQQAATVGQVCLTPGEAKNTYGTGNFLLLNTGTEKVLSENGLLTTVCYALQGEAPVYALEGSIAVTGSLVQWLRDNLGLISSAAEVEALARSVDDN